MPMCFGGYALLFRNIAELGWIYSMYMYVRPRRRAAAACVRARVSGHNSGLVLAPLAKLELPTGE